MKKKHIEQDIHEENAFALSTGDLMAGLLFIFILLLMNSLLQLEKQKEEQIKTVKAYEGFKNNLYEDLYSEFKNELSVWHATIDSSLCFRFQEPSMLFDEGYDILKPNFKLILDNFFPRYVNVINKPEHRKYIQEVRIEGHTNSNGEYYSNMKLSQDRTRTVLQYCFSTIKDESLISWLKGLITANGLSSSHLIYDKEGFEDKELSRRVEFRIRMDAEKFYSEKEMYNKLNQSSSTIKKMIKGECVEYQIETGVKKFFLDNLLHKK